MDRPSSSELMDRPSSSELVDRPSSELMDRPSFSCSVLPPDLPQLPAPCRVPSLPLPPPASGLGCVGRRGEVAHPFERIVQLVLNSHALGLVDGNHCGLVELVVDLPLIEQQNGRTTTASSANERQNDNSFVGERKAGQRAISTVERQRKGKLLHSPSHRPASRPRTPPPLQTPVQTPVRSLSFVRSPIESWPIFIGDWPIFAYRQM